MNCDECKEQVFELIEREAVDPDGVREVLSRCPECRAAFDDIKSALTLAEQLPSEEPSAGVDAAILRAAGARVPTAVPLKKRLMQPAPWAMAAIALLAVGLGVWTIPKEVQFEGDVAPMDGVQAESPSDTTAPVAALERTSPEQKKGSPEPARAKRRARSSKDEKRASGPTQSPASLAVADMAAQGAGQSQASEVAAKESAPRKQKRDEALAAADACKRKVEEIEHRLRSDQDFAVSPEEELAIGNCYRALDNVAEARKWLERAASHRKTKAAAEEVLRELAPE